MVKSMDILVKGDKIWPILELTVQNFNLLFDFCEIYFFYTKMFLLQ